MSMDYLYSQLLSRFLKNGHGGIVCEQADCLRNWRKFGVGYQSSPAIERTHLATSEFRRIGFDALQSVYATAVLPLWVVCCAW